MRRWFQRLPIHRKLVTSALLITAVALLVAMAGLAAFDTWRYRVAAAGDAIALAQVLAENTAAAAMFDDAEAAAEVLQSVRVRSVVTRACIFLPDGTLFAAFARPPDACPAAVPVPDAWNGVYGAASITRNQRTHGMVYVERSLADLRGRLMLTALAGLMMFVFAASAAYVLAQRVHAAVSRPISALARFARAYGDHASAERPPVNAAPDEIGDLARSFDEMLTRVRSANEEVTGALSRERDANRLKDEFLAAVSHELRTPLNAMMGWAQILASTRPSEDTVRKAVASIVKNAQAQTRVIEDLIDVSRIVTGKLRLTFHQVDMRAVVAAAMDTMGPVAASKGVRLERSVPAEACPVAGDRDRLQQVLWNLVSNAVKFTPPGGAVTVRLARKDGRIEVAVADTGAGIPPPFLPFVFDRFRQADGSLTREHGGLGLGLAIVKELTELHGGTVVASSEGKNRGAVFTVSLPECAPEPVKEDDRETDVPEAPLPSLQDLRIIAVDDNPDAAAIIAASLACAGADVETFTTPEEAFAAWERRPANVLVCDLAMPRMSGLELLGQIRQLDSERGVFTPAIAVSAHASEQHHAESLKGGFQIHLTKPLHQDVLIRAVAQALAGA